MADPERRSVRITRQERSGGQRVPITRKQWRDHAQADPELRFDGEDSVRWTGLAAGEFCLLVWRDGQIEALDPPPRLATKMAAVAEGLHAVAVGDRGEIYHPGGGSSPPVPEDVLARERELAAKNRPGGPLRLDPLTWQIVAWGFAAVMVLFAALVAVIVVR
jgi:hypothetical protein